MCEPALVRARALVVVAPIPVEKSAASSVPSRAASRFSTARTVGLP